MHHIYIYIYIYINTVNRFTTLGTIPKTNYSSVLASTYDPYTLVHSHQPVQTVFPRNPNASQYVKKRYAIKGEGTQRWKLKHSYTMII